MEVIELKATRSEVVLPVLQPLLEPGGVLSGMNNQLFLKTSPRNREEIKRALAAIDRPARSLIIHVALDRQSDERARGGEVSGQVVLGQLRGGRDVTPSGANATVWDSRSVRSDMGTQRVQTLEGSRALIQVGRALPVPMRQYRSGPGGSVVQDTVVYRDIGSGFYAVPRLNGQQVTLDIVQYAEQLPASPQAGTIRSQGLSTTVSGTLGEWIELGGTGRQVAAQQAGVVQVGASDARENRSIWLKVEAVE